MHHPLLILAYTLLTIAFCTSVVAAYASFIDDDYVPVPVLLFAALLANGARRALMPAVDGLARVADRALFFAWPFGVLALVCFVFGWPRLLKFIIAPTAIAYVLIFAAGGPLISPDVIQCACRYLSCFAGGLTLLLLLLRLRSRNRFLSSLEMAAVFCGAAEGVVSLVGYLAPDIWWPAIAVYCVFYVGLIALQSRHIWIHRRRSNSPNLLPT